MIKTIAFLSCLWTGIPAALCQSNGYSIATAAGGANPYFYSGLGDGNPATSAALGKPAFDVAVDGAGNLYIAAGTLVRKVTPDGKISTVAGGGASAGEFVPATQAAIWPTAIAADAVGNFIIADTAYGSSRIRMVDTKGVITTVAGGAACCTLGDGGPALDAYIGIPYGLALDASGSLYIAQADMQNNLIRKVSNGIINTIAGGGQGSGDGGFATGISLARPLGVAVDSLRNVYIAEADGNRVRVVSPSGLITTVAGNGTATTSGDGGLANQAGVNSPYHVAIDATGDVFITQINDSRVRMISPSGIITTIAGTGSNGSYGDGGAATAAALDQPAGIALGTFAQVYVAQNSTSIPSVRVLNPTLQ